MSIDMPHMCIGLIFEKGVVVNAPPIARWTIGKSKNEIITYFRSKDANIFILSSEEGNWKQINKGHTDH